jgi:O-antigen ligase
MHRTCGTVAIKNDLLFVADFSGLFHCLNAKTGEPHWTYDMFAASWASPLIVEDRVYIGDEDGDLRWLIWEAVIDFLPEYMPWGSGVGSFVPVYQIHEPNDTLMPQYVNQAHNDWLDIVLTSGVPGAALAIIAAMMFARAAGSALAARGVAGHLKQTGIGIIFVLAFASLSDYPVRTPLISALFAIAAIWACVPSAQRKTAESSDQNVTA